MCYECKWLLGTFHFPEAKSTLICFAHSSTFFFPPHTSFTIELVPSVQQDSATPHTADISVLRTLVLWDVTLCHWLSGSCCCRGWSQYITLKCWEPLTWAGMAQSVLRLAMGWTVRGSNTNGGEIFCTCPDWPWGPPSLLYSGYWIFPGGKGARAWRWTLTLA